ncbi:MAG: hypothetical protein M1825_005417 [Sarcosagium campestre]|nr:MAG: hypothetical protein M1825_005417 [Sarcosagium campestre]
MADYNILSLSLPSPTTFKAKAIHHLYVRRHEPKISTDDDLRSMFAVNIPLDATEGHFRHLFAGLSNSRVDTVEFNSETSKGAAKAELPQLKRGTKRKHVKLNEGESLKSGQLPAVWNWETHSTGSVAVIKFVDRTSLTAALKAVKKLAHSEKTAKWGAGTVAQESKSGSGRYRAHHDLRYPSTLLVQKSVDVYMSNFTAQEISKAREASLLRQEPDADGFVTVTRGGRTGPARQEEAQTAAEKQKKKQSLNDFYRFQLREERKKAQGEMLRRFEEDKRKVGEMKRKRGKFKPQ